MHEKEEVLLIGAGGVGAMGAYGIQYAGKANVSLVVRRDYQTVMDNGYEIHSIDYGDIKSWKPQNIYRNTVEASKSKTKFGIVAVATKNISDLVKVEDIIEPVIIPGETTIILIQNGFGIDRAIINKYPNNVVLSGVSHIGSHNKNGVINQIQHDKLVVSAFENPNLEKEVQINQAKYFISLHSNDRNTCIYYDDVKWYRYRKLVYNGTLNTICSLTGIDAGRLDLWGGLESIAIPAMKEIIAVAKADGVELPEDVINLVCHGDDGDYFEPSMRVDVKKGNPIELEAILGNFLLNARELNVDTPILEIIYKLLKLVQCRLFEQNGHISVPEERPISDKFYS